MKKCGNPSCSYLYADDYVGVCDNCGRAQSGSGEQGGLNFAYARQIQEGVNENNLERSFNASRGAARPGDNYDRANVHDAILDRARDMLVQREEVRYEES